MVRGDFFYSTSSSNSSSSNSSRDCYHRRVIDVVEIVSFVRQKHVHAETHSASSTDRPNKTKQKITEKQWQSQKKKQKKNSIRKGFVHVAANTNQSDNNGWMQQQNKNCTSTLKNLWLRFINFAWMQVALALHTNNSSTALVYGLAVVCVCAVPVYIFHVFRSLVSIVFFFSPQIIKPMKSGRPHKVQRILHNFNIEFEITDENVNKFKRLFRFFWLPSVQVSRNILWHSPYGSPRFSFLSMDYRYAWTNASLMHIHSQGHNIIWNILLFLAGHKEWFMSFLLSLMLMLLSHNFEQKNSWAERKTHKNAMYPV